MARRKRIKQLSLLPLLEEEWHVLTLYAPYGDLLVAGLKLWETRPKGVTSQLPIRLFLHTAHQKMGEREREVAERYLGPLYKPQYGKIIGVGKLVKVVKMTPRFINKQPSEEIDMGNWKPGRCAWKIIQIEKFRVPVPATGCQAAPWKVPQNSDLRRRILEVWTPPQAS
jgi:hypothetical protein